MILLTGTSHLLRVVTDAISDIEVHVSYLENSSGSVTVSRQNTASITTATTTTILSSPSSGVQRNARHIGIRNNHGSTACTVTVEHYDGTTAETIMKCVLLVAESLVMGEDGKWKHFKDTGATYEASGFIATQAQMETATATDVFVAPGVQQHHPGHPKFWCKAAMVNGVPMMSGAYNMTSITDTGAGRATFNIATDFSGTGYTCLATVERPATALTVTNLKFCNIRNATPAAGSIEIEVYDGTITNAVQEDPQSYSVVGLGDQ